jgi:hypothetical protein
MRQRVTLQFEFEDGELEEFPNPLYEWVFGEICQNLDFGFLTCCRVDDIPEEAEK